MLTDSGLVFYLKGTRFRFTFGFFAVWSLLLAAGAYRETARTALLCCLLHEAGHCIAMRLWGIRVKELTFYGGGIGLKSSPDLGLAGTFREISVLFAGCGVNLLLFLLGRAAGNTVFADINLALMLFNLLPFSSLDGGRILKAAISRAFPLADADGAFRVTDIIGGICAAVFFFCSGSVGFTLPLTMGMIIVEGMAGLSDEK